VGVLAYLWWLLSAEDFYCVLVIPDLCYMDMLQVDYQLHVTENSIDWILFWRWPLIARTSCVCLRCCQIVCSERCVLSGDFRRYCYFLLKHFFIRSKESDIAWMDVTEHFAVSSEISCILFWLFRRIVLFMKPFIVQPYMCKFTYPTNVFGRSWP